MHREFCEVAICEDGAVRSAGRVPATPAGVRALAQSLLASDRVALEVTGSCWEIARILEPHVNRVGADQRNGAIGLGAAAGLPGGSSDVSFASTSMLLARMISAVGLRCSRSQACRSRWWAPRPRRSC